ncbi:MAG: hypothetical protein OXD50_16305 [Chloroflexi bacterium]|nr:hypothetical protein [Chloroflexota bacterium]
MVLVACSGDKPVQERASGAQAQSESNSRPGAEAQSRRQQPAVSEDRQQLQQSESNSRPGPEAETHSEGRALADSDPLDQALAALSEWILNLDTALFEAQARMEHDGAEAVVNTRFALQRSPVAMLTSIELSALSSFIQLIEGDEEELVGEPTPGLMLHELSTAEGVFMALSGRLLAPLPQSPADVSVLEGQPLFPGWAEWRSAGEPPGDGDLLFFFRALTGIRSPFAADETGFVEFDGFDRVFGCIEEFGGTVVEERMEGEPVWVLECLVDENISLAKAAALITGFDSDSADDGDGEQLLSLRFRLVINRDTGAPALEEFVWQFRVPDEQDDVTLTGTLTLNEWNQPVELPAPEPLVDSWWVNAVYQWAQLAMDRGEESFGIWRTGEGGAYYFVSSWAAAADELRVDYSATLVIDGERRVVFTSARSSHSQGAYESWSHFEDGSISRQL